MRFAPSHYRRLPFAVAVLLGLGSNAAAAALVSSAQQVPYRACFNKSASAHDISVALLQAIAATESNYNPNARSHANAHGLMQIQWPGTARHLGVRRLAELYAPCKNIELGATYLRELLDRYDNNERRALAAYNYGPGRISQRGALPKGAQRYVATVRSHRARLVGGTPRTAPKPQRRRVAAAALKSTKKNPENQSVAEFSSRWRANRYQRLLARRIAGAEFRVVRSTGGALVRPYRVVLAATSRPLSRNDRTVLKALGWQGSSAGGGQ